MGKYDVDFEDYEGSTGGYDGEEPKRGNYPGKLVALNEHTAGNGNESIRWVFEITEGDYAGWRGYLYSNMDTAKWRTQEIVKAIQGGDEKKTKIEPGPEGDREAGEASKTVKKAGPVRLRVMTDEYEGEKRGKVRNVLPDTDAKPSKKKKKDSDDPTV